MVLVGGRPIVKLRTTGLTASAPFDKELPSELPTEGASHIFYLGTKYGFVKKQSGG